MALFTRRIITLVNTGIIAKTTSIAYIPLYAAAGTTTAIAVGSYITLQSNGVSWNCISSNFRPTPAFKAYQTVAVSIPTSVATNLAMNTEYYDVLNNLTAGTFTAPYAGLYTFSAGVTMNTSDMAGDNIIQIVNITGAVSHTSGLAESGSTGTSLYRGNITCDMLLASGDQVVLRVLQQSGVAVNTFPGASNLWFSGRGCTP